MSAWSDCKKKTPFTKHQVIILIPNIMESEIRLVPLWPSAQASSLPKKPPPITTTDLASLTAVSRSLKSTICEEMPLFIFVLSLRKQQLNIYLSQQTIGKVETEGENVWNFI